MSATTYENVLDSQMLLFFMHVGFEKHSEYIFTKCTVTFHCEEGIVSLSGSVCFSGLIEFKLRIFRELI